MPAPPAKADPEKNAPTNIARATFCSHSEASGLSARTCSSATSRCSADRRLHRERRRRHGTHRTPEHQLQSVGLFSPLRLPHLWRRRARRCSLLLLFCCCVGGGSVMHCLVAESKAPEAAPTIMRRAPAAGR